ncbi:MAG: M56 family metallopeptidase [Cognaticolwellia sp.]
MMQESLINSPFLAGLAITLIHFLWQGALVALILKALLSLISYQKSQLRYALSSLAMLANLILPIFTFFIVYDIEYRQTANFVQALPLLNQNFYLEQIQAHAWYLEWFEYLPALAILWFTVVSVLTLKLIIELYNVNKLPLQNAMPAELDLKVRFDALVTKIGLSRKVALLLSNTTDVPMAIGWLKPVVLVPLSMLSGLTPQQLDMLLLHELAHIRRHDYLVNFLQTLVDILLFFHPAVRWVSKQMRNEREYCSDDIAVQHCGSPLAYAHTLADTASLCQKHRHHTIPNMAMAASGGDLKQRILRLVETQQHCTSTNHSGKRLASFTILFTIIFAFSQHSLTLPMFDISSGNISLPSLLNELNKSAVSYTPLAFEREKSNALSMSPLLVLDDTVEKTIATPLNNKIKQMNAKEIKPLYLSNIVKKNTANSYDKELPINQKDSIIKRKTSQDNTAFIAQAKMDRNLGTTNTPSIAELAFKRTDSKSISTTKNSYSQQIASLLNEPAIPKDAQLSTLNTTQHGIVPQQLPHSTKFNTTSFSKGKLSNSVNDSAVIPLKNIAARLVNSVEPKYPYSAKRKGIELEVMVKFNIDKNGLVKDLQFESKSKVSYFRNTIRSAMEKWRFLPAKKNGRSVESKMSKIFSFSLLT